MFNNKLTDYFFFFLTDYFLKKLLVNIQRNQKVQ